MSIISASTTTTTALQYTADTTGTLVFKTGATPTTALTLNDDQSATFAGTVNFATAGFTNLSYTGTFTGGTGVVNIGSGQFYKDASGQVGIGNSSPTYRLQVERATDSVVAIKSTSTGTASVYLAGFNSTYTTSDFLLQQDGSGNAYVWNRPSSPLIFATANTERMRIDSSGNVGIGTSSPSFSGFGSGTGGLQITNAANAALKLNGNAGGDFYLVSGSSQHWLYATGAVPMSFSTNGTERLRLDSGGSVLPGSNGGQDFGSASKRWLSVNAITFSEGGAANNFITTSGTTTLFNSGSTWTAAAFYTSGSEKMRITSGGAVLIGRTDQINQEDFGVTTTDDVACSTNRASATSYYPWVFYSDATVVGYILSTSSNTTYSTTSDYRLKENVAPMTGALAKVAQLKPVTYNWKLDGSSGQGFIAHELAEVVPECVTGEKDAVNKDGSINPQGIDTSFLVATLTAAIQELKAEFDEYKATHP